MTVVDDLVVDVDGFAGEEVEDAVDDVDGHANAGAEAAGIDEEETHRGRIEGHARLRATTVREWIRGFTIAPCPEGETAP
ncbi:MAG: hypothetical protein BroJett004_02210 [Planctomycetota bacterium]|nr:MAG: hypothetical protein BroJett004_02210 [Planctomycetota bacterium]